MTPSLSVCLITRNESATLARALESVAVVAQQLIVVDTGSTDGTQQIARTCGAELFSFEWVDDFAAARNVSLSHARSDWILILDADEWLAAESAAELQSCLVQEGNQAWRVLQRNLQPPGELLQWDDTPITRLFRNLPAHRYTGRIHEQVAPSIVAGGGLIGDSTVVLMHDGYQKPAVQGGLDRRQRNLALLRRAVRASPGDAYLHLQLGITLKAAGKGAEAEAALRTARTLDGKQPQLTDSLRETLLVRLSQLALGRKATRDALKFAAAALALAEDNAIARQVQAVALLESGDLAGSLAAFETLLQDSRLAHTAAADFSALAQALRSALNR